MIWLLNISLLSAAGLAAAVGAILIPTLIKIGIKPAMAASTVLLGTWGSSVSPGNPFIVQIADLAQEDLMTIIQNFAPHVFIAVIVSALALFVIAHLRHEGASCNDAAEPVEDDGVIRYHYAIIPLIPIVILVLASPAVKMLPAISIPNAMLIGTLCCLVVTRPNVREFANHFFKGNGNGFASIVCLIAAAGMFIQGMNLMGLTQSLIDAMGGSQSMAKISATFGPFALAAISGSGNAAVLAFNGTVTPHAAAFGLQIADMGSVVQAAINHNSWFDFDERALVLDVEILTAVAVELMTRK